MKIDALTTRLRPRRPWEAVDLGVAMWREHFAPTYGIWLALVLPLMLLLASFSLWQPWLGPLLLWWFKPWYDRVALYVYSRVLFGERPGLRQALRDLPAQFGQGALLAVTFFRLAPARSFMLATWQLERLSGRRRAMRCRVLARRDHGAAIWLTLAMVHVESIFVLSILQALLWLWPWNEQQAFWEILMDPGAGAAAAQLVCYIAVICLLEPMYVACGFALYLNRRSWLEGWDLEVSFRRLAERLRRLGRGMALGLSLLLAMPLWATDALAQSGEQEGPPASAASDPAPPTRDCEGRMARAEVLEGSGHPVAEAMGRVLRDPEYLGCETITVMRSEPEDLGGGLDFAAAPLELLVWLVAGGLLAGLVVALWRDRAGGRRTALARGPAPPTALEVPESLPPEQLPDNPGEAARVAWGNGRAREAYSLLYRATLHRLQSGCGLPVGSSLTEGECLRRIVTAHLHGDIMEGARRLIERWRGLAYAGRTPSEEDFHGDLAWLRGPWETAGGGASP